MAREKKGGRRKAAESAQSRPQPPSGLPAEPSRASVPVEIAQAWVQFMRADVAESVNALNNRLNAIAGAVREIDVTRLSAGEQSEIETIRQEIGRAATITAGLLHRVDAMAPESVPRMMASYQEQTLRPAHIVVVDDDPANRSVIARLFQRFGHQVTPCANGIEAIEVLQLGPVDCVISDLRMPTLGGRTLFEQIEETAPTVASRFVFVTGDFTDPESRKFLESSGQPVVGKPYEVEDLLVAVSTILRRVGVLVDQR